MNVLQSELKQKVCRLCLDRSNCCIHLNNMWGREIKLRSMINNLLPFQIDEHDGHSRYICWNCCMHVQLLNAFVEKCVQRNETLKGAAESSYSQQSQVGLPYSQSSCTSSTGTADGSVRGGAAQRPDWLSLSTDDEVDGISATSSLAIPTETTDRALQPTKKPHKHNAIKRKSYRRKKRTSNNKENRHDKAWQVAHSKGSTDTATWKVGAQDAGVPHHGSQRRYNLRNNARVSQHLATSNTVDDDGTSRRLAKTRRESSKQHVSPEPLLIFSRNSARTEDEDARSGKTGSEFNFALDAEDSATPKKCSSQKWYSDNLMKSSRGPDDMDEDLKSLLNYSDHRQPLPSKTADQLSSDKRTLPNENLFRDKNFLGMQPQYPHDTDLSAQFARRHLSFVC